MRLHLELQAQDYIAAGVAVFLAVGEGLAGQLYELSPRDPLPLAGTCALLLIAGLTAAFIPARRAGGVDPVEALRSE